MIGMPTYGRSFTLINETQFDIGAPASGGGKYFTYIFYEFIMTIEPEPFEHSGNN